MSTKATTWVWEHSRADDTDRLVLLVIADAANADGDNAWPAVSTISRFVRKSERTVWRSLKNLVELGELEIHSRQGGKRELRADRRPNLYRLPLVSGHQRTDTPGSTLAVDNPSSRTDTDDSASVHDLTNRPSRPDTQRQNDLTLLAHEQNQNTLIEQNRDADSDLISPDAVPAKVSYLRSCHKSKSQDEAVGQ